VTRVLLEQPLEAVVQVGDAKSPRRTLLLTLLLAEAGLPLAVALNMADEAAAGGLDVDARLLAERLGVPVVRTVATTGEGVDELAGAVGSARPATARVSYPREIERAVADAEEVLLRSPLAPRALALLWLVGDPVAEAWVRSHVDEAAARALAAGRDELAGALGEPPALAVQRARIAHADRLLEGAVRESAAAPRRLGASLGRYAVHPLWGLPILLAVLYGLYRFVGVFGAGTLVALVETDFFGGIVNPWVTGWAERLLPGAVADFLVGEYGLWTMGMTYALALVLPIVATFFLAFGILEDSGYLPRLTVLANRLFSALGLNGKAVLPMVLGLGCVTMATMTTRILESKRERVLVTLLLALAVPCSAQLGVVLGMLGAISLVATTIWAGVVLAVLLAVGWLAARVVPGERSALLVELPPLRLPRASNVLVKTAARLEWYLKEVVPLFLLGTAVLFALDAAGALPGLVAAAEPLVTGWLGLPPDAASAFLLGFLRRDFGATGLFVAGQEGMLTAAQAVVAMTTITLFVPCVASVLMIGRERGWRAAGGMVALVFPLAFLAGGLLSRVLALAGWGG
jgi:ferrous iron transport protein B